MKLFEGKTKTERNKLIAAMLLGGACLIVLFFAFGRGMFSGSSTTSAKPTPTPKKSSTARNEAGKLEMPSMDEQNLTMQTQPIAYNPGIYGANPPGRNIFAFYEPPKPTPYVPTPIPPQPIVTPPPPTPYPIQIAVINPQSVYAGSNGFRMEIAGDKFSPDTKIYMDQLELPASFISETRMVADVPAPLLKTDGRKQILAQTVDGTKISNPIMLDVQPPPRPQFQYIGMIARKRNNNDTAYFQEQGKPLPTSARLNDIVGQRFRLLSISADEVIFEDTSLGFKHKLQLFVPAPGTSVPQPGIPGMQPGRGGFPSRESYTPMNPTMPNQGMPNPAGNTRIPGIPDNLPRYTPPGSNTNTVRQVTDKDDDDDTDNF